jgi:hypothetical protein
LLLAGLAAIAASFFVPENRRASAAWTDDDAARYQQLSRELHSLSFTAAGAEGKQRLADLQGEFNGMKARLETAQSRGKATAWWLRIAGFGAVAAALALQATPSRASR